MEEVVTVVPISNDYFWVAFQGPHEAFESKFESNYRYCYGTDEKQKNIWWLYYRSIGGEWEKAGQLFWVDDPDNPAYQAL